MVEKERTEEYRTRNARLTMYAARGHFHAAVCCYNSLEQNNEVTYRTCLSPVIAELILLSIEHSLKLSLFLEDIDFEPDHDIYKMYKLVLSESENQLNLQSKIVDIANRYAEENKFPKIPKRRGNEIEACIKRNRSSYVNFRYFGVKKDFRSAPTLEIPSGDIHILYCFSRSLIKINEDLMEKHGISVFPRIHIENKGNVPKATLKLDE